MNIVFFSRIIPLDRKNEILSKRKNTISESGESLQWKIINGLDKCLNTPISLYNYMPIQSFPKSYPEAYIKGHSFSHTPGADDINLPFINIQYIKRLFMGRSLYTAVKKWAKNTLSNNEKNVIITYSLTPEFTKAIKIVKRINPKIEACAIVADLPQYTILTKKKNLSSQIYLKWMQNATNAELHYIDKFVLLTDQMSNKLVTHQKYIVMEGISSEFSLPKTVQRSDEVKSIVYAGTLNERFGVLHLIEAFTQIDNKDFTLILCGIGDAEEKIKELVSKDNRIDFRGQVDRNEVLNILSSASIIVNPRYGNEDFTKYSFPSKNLEALSSGIPFVAYKLAGIPDEYDKYINYPKDESVTALSELLLTIAMNEGNVYTDKAEKARHWVAENKNYITQTKRILRLLAYDSTKQD